MPPKKRRSTKAGEGEATAEAAAAKEAAGAPAAGPSHEEQYPEMGRGQRRKTSSVVAIECTSSTSVVYTEGVYPRQGRYREHG